MINMHDKWWRCDSLVTCGKVNDNNVIKDSLVNARHNFVYLTLTALLSCAPAPKLAFPAGMGSTLASLIGSATGSVGISSDDSRRMALNIATSNRAINCSII